MTITPIQQLLKSFVEQQHMSNRQFAGHADISLGVVNRLLDERQSEDEEIPLRIETVFKLAKATRTNLITVMALAYPEVAEAVEQSRRTPLDAMLLAEQIENLSPGLREAVDLIIKNAQPRAGDKDS